MRYSGNATMLMAQMRPSAAPAHTTRAPHILKPSLCIGWLAGQPDGHLKVRWCARLFVRSFARSSMALSVAAVAVKLSMCFICQCLKVEDFHCMYDQ